MIGTYYLGYSQSYIRVLLSFSFEFMNHVVYSNVITPHYGHTTFINLLQRELVVYVLPPAAFSYYFVIMDIHHLPLPVAHSSV